MSQPACWLFFDAVLLPGDPADFVGHCHDPEYIGDCPVSGYLVPCDQCLVNQASWVLTYDTNVLPPAQNGVIITPLEPLRVMLTVEPLSSRDEAKRPPASTASASASSGGIVVREGHFDDDYIDCRGPHAVPEESK